MKFIIIKSKKKLNGLTYEFKIQIIKIQQVKNRQWHNSKKRNRQL